MKILLAWDVVTQQALAEQCGARAGIGSYMTKEGYRSLQPEQLDNPGSYKHQL